MKLLQETNLAPDIRYVLAQGPLDKHLRDEVQHSWGVYDKRILDQEEWKTEYEDGVLGPAWHCMIIEGKEVVAHSAIIPVEFNIQGHRFLGGRPEALYVKEERRRKRVPYDQGQHPYVYVVISEVLKATKSLGLASGVFTATPQVTNLYIRIGCNKRDVPLKGLMMPLDWLRYRKEIGGPIRAKDLVFHIIFTAYRAFLDLMAILVGRRCDVISPQAFDNDLDEHVIRHMKASGIAPTSRYLNNQFRGDDYLRLIIGKPPIGYAVIRRPSSGKDALLVDHFVRFKSFGLRKRLYVGRSVRRMLGKDKISILSGNTFVLNQMDQEWMNVLKWLGFVRSRYNTEVPILYYSNLEGVTLNHDWRITYLFHERF